MLETKVAMATVAVKSLEVAKRFYEGVVGMKPLPSQERALVYQTGGGALFVYESQFAGTNKATSVTWRIGGEVETLVKDLKAKGVVFEQYDMPNLTRDGDIHRSGDTKIAWFKDPDGNIHALSSR